MNTATDSMIVKAPKSSGGFMTGQGSASTDLVGFYGVTPVVQPSGAAQATVIDSSGGTANSATGVAALTGTYNSTIIANALATILAQTNKMRADLVALGLLKGSA